MRKMLLGGNWIEGEESVAVHSPYNGELITEVSMADEHQLSTAIANGKNGATEMRKLAKFEIADGLRKIAAEIERRKDEFISTMIAESAKPFIYASAEIERAIATFSIAAGEAERFTGEVVNVDVQPNGLNKTAYTKNVPRGLIYGISPFNFPLNLVAHKVAPALASGNSIIIKPSDKTPLTALMLGEAFLESGFPKSALQIIPMDVKYIDQVYNSEDVKMISFTGSAEIGWNIKKLNPKKFITLELGGNAAVIIDETANIGSLDKCITGAFSYSGQVCISVQRIFIHRNLFKEWAEKFVGKASEFKVGDPFDKSTQMSVMIDESAAKRTEQWVDQAINAGAELLCGGKRNGKLYPPTVLTNTNNTMKVVKEEVFAPVVVIESFDSFEDAVKMANEGKYGLQAGVFTNDLSNSRFAADHLDYGGVIINDVPTFRVDIMPYGGVKDSGFGREGIKYAMNEMTEIRLIVNS